MRLYRIFFILITVLISLNCLHGSASAEVKEISPQEFKKLVSKNRNVQIIDVRETWEVRRSKIPRSKHLPLKRVTRAVDLFDMERPVVTYCHHGNRSKTAAEILHKVGFKEVMSLQGGIEAYSIEIDETIPRY